MSSGVSKMQNGLRNDSRRVIKNMVTNSYKGSNKSISNGNSYYTNNTLNKHVEEKLEKYRERKIARYMGA
jgi:hypothetical protein